MPSAPPTKAFRLSRLRRKKRRTLNAQRSTSNPDKVGRWMFGVGRWMLRRLFFPGFLLERNPSGSLLERFEVLRILSIIFLVIRLGRIELHSRQDFSDDWFIEFAGVRELHF